MLLKWVLCPLYFTLLVALKLLFRAKMFENSKFCFVKLLQVISFGMLFSFFLITSYFAFLFVAALTNQSATISCGWYCPYIMHFITREHVEVEDVVFVPKWIFMVFLTSFLISIYYYFKLVFSEASCVPETPKLTKETRNISLYYNNCSKCQLNRRPHTYHGEFSCVYMYDHTCPWVCNDIGLSNKGIFFRFLFFFAVSIAFGSVVPIKFYKQGYPLLYAQSELNSKTKFEKLNELSIVLFAVVLSSKEAAIITGLLLCNFIVFIPIIAQSIEQIHCLRCKYCWEDSAMLKQCLKELKKDKTMLGIHGNEYIFVQRDRKDQIPRGGKIRYLNEVIDVEYFSKEDAIKIVKDEMRGSRGIIKNYAVFMKEEWTYRFK